MSNPNYRSLSLMALVQGLKPAMLKAQGLDGDAVFVTMFGGFADGTRVIVERCPDPDLIRVEWNTPTRKLESHFPMHLLHGFLACLWKTRSVGQALNQSEAYPVLLAA